MGTAVHAISLELGRTSFWSRTSFKMGLFPDPVFPISAIFTWYVFFLSRIFVVSNVSKQALCYSRLSGPTDLLDTIGASGFDFWIISCMGKKHSLNSTKQSLGVCYYLLQELDETGLTKRKNLPTEEDLLWCRSTVMEDEVCYTQGWLLCMVIVCCAGRLQVVEKVVAVGGDERSE